MNIFFGFPFTTGLSIITQSSEFFIYGPFLFTLLLLFLLYLKRKQKNPDFSFTNMFFPTLVIGSLSLLLSGVLYFTIDFTSDYLTKPTYEAVIVDYASYRDHNKNRM